MTRSLTVHWLGLAVAAIFAGAAEAQIDSRAAALVAEREEKARNTKPEELNGIEKALLRFKEGRWLERVSEGFHGVHPKLGGLVQGSGFSFGPEYRLRLPGESEPLLRGAAVASLRGYQKYDLTLHVPHLGGTGLFLEFDAVRHNYPRLGYYGPGPDSSKSGRSNFRLEDTALDGVLGVRALRKLTAGLSFGSVATKVGPGEDSRFASAERLYEGDVAGIGSQLDLLRFGSFLQYDYRERPDGARQGGYYSAHFSNFWSRTSGQPDFQRLDLEAQQLLPTLNERHVIALRARSAMTMHAAGERVPFYFQPALGGSEDLRGYRPYRFRDDNAVVFNAEYRWEVFSGLDMALFADAGKVAHRVSQLNLRDLESDAGFGFRFNARNKTFLRLDVGFSHEGFQVSVKFHNIFRKGLPHSSSSQEEF